MEPRYRHVLLYEYGRLVQRLAEQASYGWKRDNVIEAVHALVALTEYHLGGNCAGRHLVCVHPGMPVQRYLWLEDVFEVGIVTASVHR